MMPKPPAEPVTIAEGSDDSLRRSTSLERRLPLMISGLLVLTIAAFGFFAFTEVRKSSIAAATGQLRTIILQTGEAASRTLVTRRNTLESLTAGPTLARAIAAEATPAEQKQAVDFLRNRRLPSDTLTFASTMLVTANGERINADGISPTGVDLSMLDSTINEVRARDSVTIGVPYAKDNAMWYWAASPIRHDSLRGYVAELRRIRANPAIDQQLKGFTGQDISMFYAATGANVWTGLGGIPTAAKFDVSTLPESFRQSTSTGEVLIGVKSSVPGTSWFIVSTIPEAAVEARSFLFLRQLLGVGSVLLLAAMVGAWWVSRRVTQPLKSLTVAARQIAAGDYATREPVRTTDELGELANTFNTMAERIGESHAQLGMRIEESEALARQLHQASKAKSEFLAMMSHELRTPLSAIAGYAEILQLGMRGKLNEAQQADLGRIQANQVHLLRIINDILDLAQVESGQLQVSTQSVSMNDVMNDLEPIVLPLVVGRKVLYSVDKEVLTADVMAERDRLTQVLVNLVANAARFTEAGGKVRIHQTVNADSVHLHVTDTGIGIHPDKHEAIFQPFVQAEGGASRRAQGTGLGLAISRRLAEAMGGTLSVVSVPGEGSTFTLSLQRVDRDVSHVAAYQAEFESNLKENRRETVLS